MLIHDPRPTPIVGDMLNVYIFGVVHKDCLVIAVDYQQIVVKYNGRTYIVPNSSPTTATAYEFIYHRWNNAK
jgi:hypothetical protein